VFSPTSIRSPAHHKLCSDSSEVQQTVCKDRLDFGFVPLPELNDGPSCEGRKHGDYVPASTEAALDLRGGFIEAMRPLE
jgi:hypothetical protein